MSEKPSTANEAILEQLESLRNDIETLRRQNSAQTGLLTQDLGIKFLLDEFGELGNFWRHADARIESALNVYLTGSLIVVSAVVLLAQRITDLDVFVTVAIFVAIPLAAAGVVLAKRIADAEMIKTEYAYALDHVRRFFVENAAEITPYLVLPLAEAPALSKEGLTGPFRTSTSQLLLTVINLWAGMLLGFAVAGVGWLVVPNLSLIPLVVVGSLIAIGVIVYLQIAMRQEVKHGTSHIEARYRKHIAQVTAPRGG